MNNRIQNISDMLKPLLALMPRSQAIANIVANFPWLTTDELEKALGLAEFQIMAGK